MNEQLLLLKIELSLHGVSDVLDSDAVENISDEISMRSHLRSVIVSWAGSEKNVINVQVEMEGLDVTMTGDQMAEELFEIACATLKEVVGIRVAINSVRRLGA